MRVRPATEADAAACVEIYRPYVLNTAITFETEVPTVEDMSARIAGARATHEWLILDVDGVVTGYAYALPLNSRAAYRWSVETTVYIAQDRAGAGAGRTLYAELLTRLAQRGFRQAFACIAEPNDASDALHDSFGFHPVGHFRKAGWKLGAWHNVRWWQLDLVAPDDEVDPPPEVSPSPSV